MPQTRATEATTLTARRSFRYRGGSSCADFLMARYRQTGDNS